MPYERPADKEIASISTALEKLLVVLETPPVLQRNNSLRFLIMTFTTIPCPACCPFCFGIHVGVSVDARDSSAAC